MIKLNDKIKYWNIICDAIAIINKIIETCF